MTQIFVPQTQPIRRRWLPFVVAGAVIAVAGVVAVVAATGSSDSPSRRPLDFLSTETALSKAQTRCDAGTLGDEDHTLLIDMMGEEYSSGTATIDDVGCVLAALAAPTSVTARMDSTRALDGMQTATWDGYSASWTYHPDDGLDLIITESD
jgi:hypothetical protein